MSSDKDVGVIDREWIEFNVGRSNTIILTENEAQIAKDLLGEVQGKLDRIDLEIVRLNAVIDDLKAQREVILAQTVRIRTAMAPHKRLPSELLSAIFIDTLYSGRALIVQGNLRESWPWPLHAVCSRWRDIAISDIRLWKSVTCHLQEMDEHVGESLSMALQSITASCELPPSRLEIDIGEYADLSHEHYSQFQPRYLSFFPPLPTPITGLRLSLFPCSG
ncbi:hypothetical protein Hypma_004514 [Hypsizygus marmoreus]|uniref:Uncharacterized protein n=1 Tax=Hypsizygus marmoreus TaxID=39966 RepID=A0A369K5X0_HYPMA|nr:hypothetical protein Hypma_004514 [Hypsizygus marmoreus]